MTEKNLAILLEKSKNSTISLAELAEVVKDIEHRENDDQL